MLKESGSMVSVNVQIVRERTAEYEEGLQGAWHTESSLALVPGWTEFFGHTIYML